jgi:hypothetical protein
MSASVRVTSTWSGLARACTRAAMCTAIPRRLASNLNLASVQSHSHRQAEPGCGVADSTATGGGAAEIVEGGQDPFASVQLPAVDAPELAPHGLVVTVEQLAPGTVAHRSRRAPHPV